MYTYVLKYAQKWLLEATKLTKAMINAYCVVL